MTAASKFMALLKENDVLGAIDTIKEELSARARAVAAEYEVEAAKHYGMSAIQEEEEEEESEEDKDDSDDEDDEGDEDKSAEE